MWVKFNGNPCGRYEVGDCTIRALSLAIDVDWDTAFWMLAESANNMCDVISGNAVLAAVLRKYGFYKKIIPDYLPPDYTAEDFCKDNPNGVFVLGFGNHVSCVIDGIIYDSWDSSKNFPQYYFYRKE